STGDRRTSRIEKADQGRRVYRMPFPRVGARDPGPAPVDPRPAAVMERREPPGLVVDPGPAPRAEVAPVSLAIRHPRRSDLRIPDAAVVLSLSPRSVQGKVGPARQLQHGQGRRRAMRLRRPAQRSRSLVNERTVLESLDPAGKLLGPLDDGRLVADDLEAEIRGADLGCPLDDADLRRVLRVAGRDIVAARSLERDHAARGSDGPALVVSKPGEVDQHLALRLSRAENLIVQLNNVEFSGGVHRQRVRTDLQLSPRVRLRPERVTRRNGKIQRRSVPMRGIPIVPRNTALDLRQTSHTI